MSITTYEAKIDNVGAFVPLQNRRRCLVIKYHDGKFAYVCGVFGGLAAAQRRADYLNAHHASAVATTALLKQEG